MDLAAEGPADILLLGCGDPRNVLYTVFSEGPNNNRVLDFTCCDFEPAVLARNVLLLSLIADGHPDHLIWNSHTLLIEQCKKLIEMAESPESWRQSPYGESLKMATDYTLSEIKRHWELYVAMPDLPRHRRKSIDDEFTAVWKQTGMTTTAMRSLGALYLEGAELLKDSLQIYWKTGTTYTDGKSIANVKFLNPTFVYSLAGEGCSLHYATDPLTCFHLAPIFAAEKPSTYSFVVKGARSQFAQWCAAYRSTLSNPFSPTVRCFLGDATAVCHAIRVFDDTGSLHPGIPVAQWKTQLIKLSSWEYVESPRPAPTRFNAIHTSNLEDHIGLVNVVISAQPLLSPMPSSVMYTESLLFLGTDATKEFVDNMKADITVMGILLGLCPVDYLCGYTTRSNMHDLMNVNRGFVKKEVKVCQYHQMVTWRSPQSGDAIATQMRVPPPSYDPQQLGTFFYNLYQSFFSQETTTNFIEANQQGGQKALAKAVRVSSVTAQYTRETFVLLLKLFKDRLQPSAWKWEQAVSVFEMHLQTKWSAAKKDTNGKMLPGNMETLHYQDLCGQLHRYGLYTSNCFRQGRIIDLGPFSAWPSIPTLIRVVLVVPRTKLAVFEKSHPDRVGTPALHCGLAGHNKLNFFTSVHAAFGHVAALGTKSEPRVRFDEDPAGRKGSSPLVLSFTVPSFTIFELEPLPNLSVEFYIRDTIAAQQNPTFKPLGQGLIIFSAKLLDTSLVHILPEPTPPAKRRNLSRSVQIGRVGQASMEFDPDCEHIAALCIRLNLEDNASIEAFSSEGGKATPGIRQVSACVIRLTIGQRSQDIAYPFPINASDPRLRLARKSRYIEIILPPSRMIVADGMTCSSFPVIPHGTTPFPWSVHRVNLSLMPTINLGAKGLEKWLNPHVGIMLSTRERAMLKKHADDVLTSLKDTIRAIIIGVAGTGGSARRTVFQLVLDGSSEGDTFLFMNGLRFDLGSHTVVCDGYVLTITDELLEGASDDAQQAYKELLKRDDMPAFLVSQGEMEAWKQLLPSLVERCRSGWTHGPNCEYASQGSIPLSQAFRTDPLCRCGQGKSVDEMLGVEHWRPLAAFFTRIAISPLFAVSYLEKIAKARNGVGKECGMCNRRGGNMKACAACKKVCYCSVECQKKDWKSHKQTCQA
ncbi:hypothetical protein DFP72DRAFT_904020 [Ephemerocybe angulata]|uniref:MYND-type domain-containing protein n=1 Tax=Ephemerocybe angulata TaxID=980116 RepID=A0A8H6HTJ0_9AGAR|nr:hypothetical protein DFP72DRAFT_904020 [Tulosesus angulatus]